MKGQKLKFLERKSTRSEKHTLYEINRNGKKQKKQH